MPYATIYAPYGKKCEKCLVKGVVAFIYQYFTYLLQKKNSVMRKNMI